MKTTFRQKMVTKIRALDRAYTNTTTRALRLYILITNNIRVLDKQINLQQLLDMSTCERQNHIVKSRKVFLMNKIVKI